MFLVSKDHSGRRSILERTATHFWVVSAVCVAFAYLRWTKIPSLMDEDPSWVLGEVARFARGELPYRDFLWLYPPLGIFLTGYPLRWFGATFAGFQVTED